MRKKANNCIIIAAAVCVALCSCTPKLVILHVNDTHSHYEPIRSGDDAGQGGIIERAAFVDSVRARFGEDRVLLLHDGDFSQGSSYFVEFEGTVETSMINAMGYDCVTLGNHEFDNDVEPLETRVAQTKCPVVCANLDLSNFSLSEYVKPYTVLKKNGLKIGIIGMISYLSKSVTKTVSARIDQLDNVEVLNKYSRILKDDEHCDMIIVLSHMGYESDLEVIPKTHFIDIVIGGHSHKDLDEMVCLKDADGKKVRMVTDGCFGKNVGELKIW